MRKKELFAVVFLVVSIILLLTCAVVEAGLNNAKAVGGKSVNKVSTEQVGVVSLVIEKSEVLDEKQG